MKHEGCFRSTFVISAFQKRGKNSHMLKMIAEAKASKQKTSWDGHSKQKFARYVWSTKFHEKTVENEFLADQKVLHWWQTETAFTNMWKGRSYAQVVTQKRKLPLPGACILQTSDRIANTKKVKHFLKINNKPQQPTTGLSTCRKSVSKHLDNLTRCNYMYNRNAKVIQTFGRTASTPDLTVESISLRNRLHGLPLKEDMVQDYADEDSTILSSYNKNVSSPKIQSSSKNVRQIVIEETRFSTPLLGSSVAFFPFILFIFSLITIQNINI